MHFELSLNDEVIDNEVDEPHLPDEVDDELLELVIVLLELNFNETIDEMVEVESVNEDDEVEVLEHLDVIEVVFDELDEIENVVV